MTQSPPLKASIARPPFHLLPLHSPSLFLSISLFLDWKHDNSNIYLIAAQRDPLSPRPTEEYTYILD